MNKSNESNTLLQNTIRNCRSIFVNIGIFSLFINLLLLVPPLYMLQIYDRILISRSESTLLMMTLIACVLLLTMAILEWVRGAIMLRMTNKLELELSGSIFTSMFEKSLAHGIPNNQPLADLNQVRQFFSAPSFFAFFDAPWSPIYLIILYLLHPLLGIIATIGVILLVSLTLLNDKGTRSSIAASTQATNSVGHFTQSNLRNIEVITAMGMLGNVQRRWQERHIPMLKFQNTVNNVNNYYRAASRGIRLLLQTIILGAGAFLAIQQIISPGIIIASSILLGRALAPIDQILASWRSFVTARNAYTRLNKLLEEYCIPQDKMTLPAPSGQIQVDKLIVVPPNVKQAVLFGISFNLKQGETLGLIGPSAAGKSSLLRSLLGIWPAYAGTIRFDGANIKDWNPQLLGPHIGYLPQDIELFDGSVADNISRFDKVDPNLVVAAAKLSGVHEMILKLPQGYDSKIGTSGSLSAGQRQRIGLARALYNSPRIVMLDEPNSNLDDHGELALYNALIRLKENKTTIIIVSHRLNVLKLMDTLLILKEGKIMYYGPRDEVAKKLTSKNLNKESQPATI